MVPSRISISCWSTRAGQPLKDSVCSRPLSRSCPATVISTGRRTSAVTPGRQRLPSAITVVSVPDATIRGLASASVRPPATMIDDPELEAAHRRGEAGARPAAEQRADQPLGEPGARLARQLVEVDRRRDGAQAVLGEREHARRALQEGERDARGGGHAGGA